MNKILKTITKRCFETRNKSYVETKGNYKIVKTEGLINHLYYNHLICIADLKERKFYLDFCGYNGYRLTTAQINFLRNFYEEKGFELVEIYD